ncbi:predicted protein [Botrytis cinerea T4]|uniref:Uncharacterized protein n=1 Tax=Botryotinia fuckeliana (strain T4) TaxID=999810 RepID=G2YPE7_BOTF4|nr:predicted protein [Botrytis cinerea T4]
MATCRQSSKVRGLDAEADRNRTNGLDCSEVVYKCCTSDSLYYHVFAHLDVQVTLSTGDLHMRLLHQDLDDTNQNAPSCSALFMAQVLAASSNAIPWRSITNGKRGIETMERRRNVQERPVTVLAGQWQTVNVLWQSSFGTG